MQYLHVCIVFSVLPLLIIHLVTKIVQNSLRIVGKIIQKVWGIKILNKLSFQPSHQDEIKCSSLSSHYFRSSNIVSGYFEIVCCLHLTEKVAIILVTSRNLIEKTLHLWCSLSSEHAVFFFPGCSLVWIKLGCSLR